MMKNTFIICALSTMLFSCSGIPTTFFSEQHPKQAFFNRGEPESLLDYSSEVVNLTLESSKSIREVTKTINRDQPTRAELYCVNDEALCKKAKNVLEQFSVPVTFKASGENRVALMYDRVQVRDCQNRFINLHYNPKNLNSPTLGCAKAANQVQMITDKRQLTNPATMGAMDAKKPIQAIQNYNMSEKPSTDFETNFSSSSGGGGSGGGSSR
jgi:Pilus biogenesis CpaD protein (pilus_cpaD)